jgi:hypothetical protein
VCGNAGRCFPQYKAAWVGLVPGAVLDEFAMENRVKDIVQGKSVRGALFVHMVSDSDPMRVNRLNDLAELHKALR